MFTFSLLLVFAYSLVSAQNPTPSLGLTRDFCNSSQDCSSPRSCYILQDATLLPSDTPCPSSCRCAPPSFTQCQASSDCDDGEVCARTLLFPFVCTSSVFVDRFRRSVVTMEDSISDPLVPSCAPPSTPVKGAPLNGLVLDPCRPGTCADGLSCVFSQGNGNYQCCSEGDCLCHAPDTRPICEDSDDCNQGEVCGFGRTLPQQCYGRRRLRRDLPAVWKSLTILNTPPMPTPGVTDDGGTATIGAISTPTATATVTPVADEPEDAICVDANALSHLSQDQLVFKNHPLARVLCDLNDSCATPGHIVKFKGSAMMMKSYCLIAGCVEKVIKVNSARYRRGFLTSSNTNELEYTAFAARFATRTEEGVLAAAVRLGL